MTDTPVPDGLIELVADARDGEVTDERVETFWEREYVFQRTEDGRLQVWEWHGESSDGITRSFLTTFTLEGHDDAEVARYITDEYAWFL